MRKEMNIKSENRLSGSYDNLTAKDAPAYERMYDLIRQKVKGRTVLELEAGTGRIAEHIVKSAGHIEATDASADMIEKAKQPYRSKKLHFSVQDARELPYADQSFDVVIMAQALHKMPQPEKALAEARRVLKDGGIFIAPDYTNAKNLLIRFGQRVRKTAGPKSSIKWSAEEYTAFLSQNGWTIERAQTLKAVVPITYVECRKEMNS